MGRVCAAELLEHALLPRQSNCGHRIDLCGPPNRSSAPSRHFQAALTPRPQSRCSSISASDTLVLVMRQDTGILNSVCLGARNEQARLHDIK